MSPLNQSLGIDQYACFATRKAARRITRFYDSHLEPVGLRITQFLTLAALSEVECVAVNALAERLDIERTAWGKWSDFWSVTASLRSRRRPPMAEAASSG